MFGSIAFLLVSFLVQNQFYYVLSAPNVNHLKVFYCDTISFITVEADKIISSLLATLNENGISSLKSTLEHILENVRAFSDTKMIFEGGMCMSFDAYKNAIGVAVHLRVMRDAIADHSGLLDKLDGIYNKWTTLAPEYESAPTARRITLMYTIDNWYLSHGSLPDIGCCEKRYSVDDWERNFWFKQLAEEEVVRYGDVIGVGYKNVFLSDQGPQLNWAKTWVRSWEKWRVENFCRKDYEVYDVVRIGDLVLFHTVVEGGHYFAGGGYWRTTTNGGYHYAVLDASGNFPTWRN